MDKFKWFVIAFVLGLALCIHAFYPTKIDLSSSLSPIAPQQQLADNLGTFKFITSNQQLKLRLNSVINDDDESKPVLFDLVKTWGGDVIVLLLAGLILLITPLLQKYCAGTHACFPADYWNLKNLQFRFSHSRN